MDGKSVGGKFGAYVTVGPDDAGFDAAVEALGLPDGAFFTVVSGGSKPDAGDEEEAGG